MLAILLSSLTASQASESLSFTGPIAGTVSGEGMTATFVRCIAGSGGDNASTLPSVGGFSALAVETGIGVDWEGLE
jgi:hypothetical protein